MRLYESSSRQCGIERRGELRIADARDDVDDSVHDDVDAEPGLLNVLSEYRDGWSSLYYFGMGSTMRAFSANNASPALPLIRYWTFSCFVVPGTGSPPKLSL